MPQGHRPDRVGDQIRQEITVLLQRAVHDPGIGFVTVTRVVVTPDLQLARVFYTTLGGEAERRETARGLNRALPFLRRQVGERLRLRRVPVLQFLYDKSIQNQERVEQLLREIHEAETPPTDAPPTDAPPTDAPATDAPASDAPATGEPPFPPNHDRHEQD